MSAYENFSAEISKIKIKLIFTYILSGKKLVIEMTDLRGANAKGRMPAYYQYLEPISGRVYAIFKLIAGPGISITLNGYPPEPYEPNAFYPLVEIIRVQDPELVPTIGTDFNTQQLLGEFQVNPPEPPQGKNVGDLRKWYLYSLPPTDFFTLSPINNGIIIRHHQSKQDLIITVPRHSGDKEFLELLTQVDKLHSDAQFAFQINAGGGIGAKRENKFNNLPILEIVKTPAVKIELAREPIQYTPGNVLLGGKKTSTRDIFFEIYETDKIANVPSQGKPFNEIKSYWQRLDPKTIPIIQPIILSPELTALDLAVRFVPALGDVVDIAEFVKGWYSGRDLYGRKLSSTEIAILGIGALLPFAASGTARSVSALRRSFGRRAEKAAALIDKIKKGGINAEDAKLIREAEKRIKKGLTATAQQVEELSRIYKKIKSAPPTIDQLLNVDGTGFMHTELQEAYRAYVKNRTNPASPRDWAMGKTRNPEATKLLKAFLGSDYIRRAKYKLRQPQQLINNFEVPRPMDLSDDEAMQLLAQFFKQPKNLSQRLEDFFPTTFAGINPKDVLEIYRLRTATVTQGMFNVLKGNLAEILSKEIKLRHLDEIRKTIPNAKLISGLKIQLMEKGKLNPAKLFADDVIAVIEKGNLRILKLYEVKSGYRGGREATEQIFDWIEGRLPHAEGSRLLLPDGQHFTYDPRSRAKDRVIGLNNAPRCIITAKGASHLGVDSSMQVVARTERIELDITSAQMEEKLKKQFFSEYLEEVGRKKQLAEFSSEFMDELASRKIRVDFSNEFYQQLARKKSADVILDIIPPPQVEYLENVTSPQLDYLVAEIFSKVTIK
ncbi:Uncharacterised protein [Legionella lansingensis]|uniref:Uncharacterized protein n=1 Tax=Legionella lansingensis TaxID=45067 RepID=A0A0W0VSA8_9GAMM|nr:hypothetical protein [Legionella lansingensis]KTD23003.1 hypothetical protein Llan_0964 [Legionella lansingensis]SNV51305.1 Uncharacterised protein [Legionella lansingensis]